MNTTTIFQIGTPLIVAFLLFAGTIYKYRKRNDLFEEESEERIKADGTRHIKSKKRYKY